MIKLTKKFIGFILALSLVVTSVFSVPQITAGAKTYGDFEYTLNYNNTAVEIQGYNGRGGDVVIPESIDNKPVTSIGDQAFYGCTGLKSITIPDSVTSIVYEAFRNCTGLTSITIPDSVTSIGDGAFECCTGLTSVIIAVGVTTIGNGAFYGCTGLTNIIIPNSVTSIGWSAFYGCTGLETVIYCGTETQWNNIEIEDDNDCLLSASRQYNYEHVHAYDNVCDTDCNVCGYVRTPPHRYKTVWSNDGLKHWHECSACGDITDIADHIYDNACDTTCNICGYVRTATHNYKTVWSTDSTQHWHECEVCCTKKDTANHVFDNACDTTCNTCGYTRLTTHSYKTAWSSNGTQHWHECEVCGTKKDTANHVFDNACDTTCNDCGYVRTAPHQYKNVWSGDTKRHWLECELCGHKKDVAKHTFGGDDLTCSICQYTLFEGTQNAAIIGNQTAYEGQEIEYTVYLRNCPDATSLGISLTYDSGLSLISADWLKSGGLKTFNLSINKGALGSIESPDVNGAVIKFTFKVLESSNTAQNVSVNVIGKYHRDVIMEETITKSVTISQYLPGDLDGNEEITDADAVYLLMNTFFPDDYPLNQPCDFNGDGQVTDADAVYLLMYTFFPEDYPIA